MHSVWLVVFKNEWNSFFDVSETENLRCQMTPTSSVGQWSGSLHHP